MEEKTRISKISVNIDQDEDVATISLYKTNQAMGTFTHDKLGIVSPGDSGVSMKAYQLYCKDVAIQMLNNNGIDGLYYEPKDETVDHAIYDFTEFKRLTLEFVSKILGDMEFKPTFNETTNLFEQSKSKSIKNASADFEIALIDANMKIKIRGEIKSGQICKPKIMIYGEEEIQFNITNVKKLIRQSIK